MRSDHDHDTEGSTAIGPSADGVAELVTVTVALLLLTTGYGSVVDGSQWVVTTVLVVAGVLGAIVVMRLIGMRYVVTPLALLVGLVIVAWSFVPGTLVGGLVPTPSTIESLNQFGIRAREIVLEEQAPVAASAPVVLTMAAAFGALVVLADRLLRTRWALGLIGVLLLAVYLTPPLISGASASPWLFLAVAAAWLCLLWGRTGSARTLLRRGRGTAALVGAGGLMTALLFPVVSPDIDSVAASWGKPPPQVFGQGINPMLELGKNLRRDSSVVALTYSTELDDPPYLKVATLTDFTGKTWRPAERLGFTRFEGALELADGVEAEPKKTSITIRRLRSELLPVPYPAVDVAGLRGGFRWERTGQTVVTNDQDNRGETYTVTSLDVQPTADQLRSASPQVPRDFEEYLRLPDDPDLQAALDDIEAQAREVTAGASTNFDRAMELQDWFRNDFEYSETAPVADDYDGNGITVLREFLRRKAGYCVHFSSAMAVMARSLGMPARVAVGYAPGTSSGLVDGEREYTVTSDRLHAWTEIYFNGAGWVRFDPTASIGEASEFEDAAGTTGSTTPEDQGSQSTQGDQGAQRQQQDAAAPDQGGATEDQSQTGRAAIAAVVALLLIGLLPLVIRRVRRWWRLRDDSSPDPAWREVQATAHDLGLAPSATETPRAFAERVDDRPGVDHEAVQRLLQGVETSRFSRDGGAGSVRDAARAVTSSLESGATRRERWRARLLPRSLAARP